MALRLRRGLDVERQSVIFAEGEPIYTTDTKKIHIGDGSTPGGLLVSGLLSLNDDPTPRLGGTLDLNANDIVGIGNINIVGDITITGAFNAGFIVADYRGSLFANDSSIIVDGNNKAIHASIKAEDSETMFDAYNKSFNLQYTQLESLSDVGPATSIGDFLQWNGTEWKGEPFGGSIDGTPPAPYAIPQFNQFNGWISSTQVYSSSSTVMMDTATGFINISGNTLGDLGDVAIDASVIVADDVLVWDGLNWVPKQISLDIADIGLGDLDDVVVDSINLHDTLTWDGVAFTNTPGIKLDELSIAPDSTIVRQANGEYIHKEYSLNGMEGFVPNVSDSLVWDGTSWRTEQITLETLIGSASNNNIIIYDGSNYIVTDFRSYVPIVTNASNGQYLRNVNGVLVGSDIDSIISAANSQIGDTLIYDGFNFVPVDPTSLQHNQVLQANLLADDSSVMVDILNQNIFCKELTLQQVISENLTASESIAIRTFGDVTSNAIDPQGILRIERLDNNISFAAEYANASSLSGFSRLGPKLGSIRYASSSDLDTPGQNRSIHIIGYTGGLLLGHSLTNEGSVTSEYLSITQGNLNVGDVEPATERLEVQGNAKVNGFVQFGSYTTTERDVIAAQNGMVLFNTTTGKFQGYAVNQWVDLH